MAKKAIDPTKNVLQLVKASVKRIDDLRQQQTIHDHELRVAETKRIDANFENLKLLISQSGDMSMRQLNRLTELVSALQLEQSKDKGKSTVSMPLIVLLCSFVTGLISFIVARYLK